MADGSESKTNEEGSTSAGTSAGGTGPKTPGTTAKVAAKIDLPDTAWPTGGYYWTVVPVVPILKPGAPRPLPGATFPVEYRETELPQDACQTGRVMRFGKALHPSSRSPTAVSPAVSPPPAA